jgi:hypothetical protein
MGESTTLPLAIGTLPYINDACCFVSRALSRGEVDTSVGDVGRHLDVDVQYVLNLLGRHSTWISLLFVLLSVVSQIGPVQHSQNV